MCRIAWACCSMIVGVFAQRSLNQICKGMRGLISKTNVMYFCKNYWTLISIFSTNRNLANARSHNLKGQNSNANIGFIQAVIYERNRYSMIIWLCGFEWRELKRSSKASICSMRMCFSDVRFYTSAVYPNCETNPWITSILTTNCHHTLNQLSQSTDGCNRIITLFMMVRLCQEADVSVSLQPQFLQIFESYCFSSSLQFH